MNDKHWEAREQQLIDLIATLREQNDNLTQQLQAVTSERAEDRAELGRHHDDFLKISGLASDIEEDLRWFSGREMHPTDQTLDEWFSIIRSIRNIVG